jgi:hypothetical protein
MGTGLLFMVLVTGCKTEERIDTAPNSAGPYVQAFYDWYVPLVRDTKGGPAWATAIDQRSRSFTADVKDALRADVQASAKDSTEVVGLDGDPFLNAQAPCERYVVGTSAHLRSTSRVSVHSICGGQRSDKPIVVAEVMRHDSTWVFVNFYYPDNHSDLLGQLKQLRAARPAK